MNRSIKDYIVNEIILECDAPMTPEFMRALEDFDKELQGLRLSSKKYRERLTTLNDKLRIKNLEIAALQREVKRSKA